MPIKLYLAKQNVMNIILLVSCLIVRYVWDWKKSIFLKLGQVVIQCLFSQPQGTLQDEE